MTTHESRPSAGPDGRIFSFGGFFLDATRRVLFGLDGEPVALAPRAFDTLLFLVEHAGELLEKRTLMKAIWPDVIVEENNLSQNILLARRALGEAPGEHRFIVTVPGRGFRFVAPVTQLNAIPQPDLPPRSQPTTAAQRSRVRAVRAFGLAAAGALMLVFGYVLWERTGSSGSGETSTRDAASAVVATPTIAVLPFADMSPNQDQGYFADGLAEELAGHLSRLPGLRVIGRSSAFSFKGKNQDLRAIGNALGVRHILEGSVRKAGDQLRITAQLVDATNGTRVWHNTYEQKLGDVFAIQDAVAKSVAAALSVSLRAGDVDIARGGTRNIEAYDAYLAGKAIISSGSPADIRRGLAHLERAVELDPQFALAWSELARTYHGSGWVPERGSAEWRSKALRATSRALELAPDLPSVLAAAAVTSMQRRDWTEAERRLKKARDLATGSENVWEQSGWFCMNVGRPSEAVAHFRHAKLAEPLLVMFPVMLAAAHEWRGELDQAEAELMRSTNLAGDPAFLQYARLTHAMARRDRAQIETVIMGLSPEHSLQHAMRARLDEPRAALAELRRLAENPAYPRDTVSQADLALWAAYFGDPVLSLQILRKVPSDAAYAWVIWRRTLTGMRQLPGFKDLVRDLGLVTYWRASGNWGDFCRPLGAEDFECT